MLHEDGRLQRQLTTLLILLLSACSRLAGSVLEGKGEVVPIRSLHDDEGGARRHRHDAGPDRDGRVLERHPRGQGGEQLDVEGPPRGRPPLLQHPHLVADVEVTVGVDDWAGPGVRHARGAAAHRPPDVAALPVARALGPPQRGAVHLHARVAGLGADDPQRGRGAVVAVEAHGHDEAHVEPRRVQEANGRTRWRLRETRLPLHFARGSVEGPYPARRIDLRAARWLNPFGDVRIAELTLVVVHAHRKHLVELAAVHATRLGVRPHGSFGPPDEGACFDVQGIDSALIVVEHHGAAISAKLRHEIPQR
mmetsp:Transcript_55832/g.155476  ORF Transcript_55832/g.155476 Transcript_55832/m.155476 type:complete len:308 (+) Transcript_55832:329-1252(+)